MKAAPRLTTGLLSLCCVLAAALAWLWLLPGAQGRLRHAWSPPPAQAPALSDLAVELPAPHAIPLGAYAATLERPLFVEARRPLPSSAAAAPPAAAPDELEQAQLMGIVAGPAFVGVLARTGDQVRVVRRGQTIGGWTLHAVRDREVVFTQSGRERTLKLEYAHAAAVGGGQAAASTPAVRAAAPARPAPGSAPAPTPAPAPAKASSPVTPPVPAAASAPARAAGQWVIGGRPVGAARPAASAPAQ